MNTLITKAGKNYHQELLSDGVLIIDTRGIPGNADSSSKLSVSIARGTADHLMAEVREKAVGQTAPKTHELSLLMIATKHFLGERAA